MEKTYAKNQNTCYLAQTGTETIQFLLNFSKSFHVMKYKCFTFESTLN